MKIMKGAAKVVSVFVIGVAVYCLYMASVLGCGRFSGACPLEVQFFFAAVVLLSVLSLVLLGLLWAFLLHRK